MLHSLFQKIRELEEQGVDYDLNIEKSKSTHKVKESCEDNCPCGGTGKVIATHYTIEKNND